MVFYIQVGAGNLIRVKNMSKAKARAKALQRSAPDQPIWLITAKDASEVGQGYGVKRVLKL